MSRKRKSGKKRSLKQLKKKKKFSCPYGDCKAEYQKPGWLRRHLLIYHSSTLERIGFVLTIILFIFGVASPIYNAQVKYAWDKYVLGNEIDFVFTVTSYYNLRNDRPIVLAEYTEMVDYLNELVVVGIIPPHHGNVLPQKWTLVDERFNESYCMFSAWHNIHRIVPEDEIPPDLEYSSPEDVREFAFYTPACGNELDLIPDWKRPQECEECLVQLYFGRGEGKRTIDSVNLEICYGEGFFIESTNLEKDGSHCVRIKRSNIIEGEGFLGYVYLKDYKDPTYYNLWAPSFFNVNGEVVSQGITVEFTPEMLAQVNGGVIPMCEFP